MCVGQTSQATQGMTRLPDMSMIDVWKPYFPVADQALDVALRLALAGLGGSRRRRCICPRRPASRPSSSSRRRAHLSPPGAHLRCRARTRRPASCRCRRPSRCARTAICRLRVVADAEHPAVGHVEELDRSASSLARRCAWRRRRRRRRPCRACRGQARDLRRISSTSDERPRPPGRQQVDGRRHDDPVRRAEHLAQVLEVMPLAGVGKVLGQRE